MRALRCFFRGLQQKGSITFKDEKSGSVVTLQSSEVKEITEDEFKTAVKPEEKKSK